MLRGAQKKMIVMRTHNSRMFEEAYFVMRQNVDTPDPVTPVGESDILTEANRILEGSLAGYGRERHARERSRLRLSRALWFVGGLLTGGGIVGILWAVV